MEEVNKYKYTPLPEPIPIIEQEWPEGTLPLVHTRTMTFMHENYIRDCIEGILMQKTTFPVQVLIHDDASTDKTAEIVREYETKYPQLIKAYYQKENTYSKKDKSEKKKLRETFTSWRTGKYEALCEGDDYWTDPLKLQKQVEFMEMNPDYSACFTNAIFLNEMDGTQRNFVENFSEGCIKTEDIIYAGGSIFPTASILYRIDSIDPGFQNKNKFLAGDTMLIINLALNGKVYFMNDVTCVYRRWSGGIYSQLTKNPKRLVDYLEKTITGYRHLNSITRKKYKKQIERRISEYSILVLRYGKGFRRFRYLISIKLFDVFLKLYSRFIKNLVKK